MYRTYILLAALPTLISAACNGAVGAVASAVKGLPEAQSFCSAKFPAPISTVSASGRTVTITAGGVTNTITGPAVTRTADADASTVTNTITVTNGNVVTITETVTAANAKRAVRPTTTRGNPALSSLFSTASAVASSICRCVQPAKVTTITPTNTATITPKGTVTLNPTVTVTNRQTVSTVVTITENQESTKTFTTTVTPSPTGCNPNGGGSGTSTCQDGSECNNPTKCEVLATQDLCYSDVGCSGDCIAATYDSDNHICYTFYECCPSRRRTRRRSARDIFAGEVVTRTVGGLEMPAYVRPGKDIEFN